MNYIPVTGIFFCQREMSSLQYEVIFWRRILQDHITFIYDALISEPHKEVAMKLKDDLMNVSLSADALLPLAEELRMFKMNILKAQLTPSSNIKIMLDPSAIKDMISEVDEAIAILKGVPTKGDVLINKLWISDAVGHCVLLLKGLDPVENKLVKQVKHMKKRFKEMLISNESFIIFTLAVKKSTYDRLYKEVDDIRILMDDFILLLRTIQKGLMDKSVIGHLDPLLVDHMIREELYYLRKLGFNVPSPNE